MSNGRDIVITAYGHDDRNIDKIAVSAFDSVVNHYGYSNDSNAGTYCDTINSLELNGNSWVLAKIVPENAPFSLDAFVPLKFDIILKLDNFAVQKTLREVDVQDLAKALKGAKETIKEKIFRNLSKRAAQILKEDIEFMNPIQISDVKECQKKIVDTIRHLEQTGKIVILHSEGDMVE
jgi:flagellar motor switch protein FliG